MFTSSIGEGTDRGPKRKFIDATPVNIDLMVETIAQLKTTTGYEKTKDFLNILERFAGKIETGKNLREEIEKMKKEIAEETSVPTAPISSQKSDSPTTTSGQDFNPDSIFVREQWERRASDGSIIESGDSSKKVINPDKNTKKK